VDFRKIKASLTKKNGGFEQEKSVGLSKKKCGFSQEHRDLNRGK
jgi:hypothetical protein